MDAFFASIEQRDNDSLRGKPVAVGYSGSRGVVSAASYEARRFGVKSAMSSKVAIQKCPHLIFVPSRFEIYKAVSKQIMAIFHDYTHLVEPLSLDEAFLDVTENFKNIPSATQIAEEIRERIYEETLLTASAGVSFNKFLAKTASNINKPNGLFVIKPQQAEAFVEQMPIELFFGIGKVTAKKMHQMGIKTGLDLKMRSEAELTSIFGKAGYIYHQNARSVDDREVNPNRTRKSIGSEFTFNRDMDSVEELTSELENIAKDVIDRIKRSSFSGRTIILKVKYADFTTITRSKTLPHPITDFQLLFETGKELMKSIDIRPKIRLLGLTIKTVDTNLWTDAIQLELNFEEKN